MLSKQEFIEKLKLFSEGSVMGIPAWLLVMLIVLVSIVVLFACSLVFGQRSVAVKVQKKLNVFRDSLKESLKRRELIDGHVKDYMTSLPASSRADYLRVKSLLELARAAEFEVESLCATGGYIDYLKADAILETDLAEFQTGENTLIGEGLVQSVNCMNLEEYVDTIFQKIGAEVAIASNEARIKGLKPRRRAQTIESLFNAGVRYVNKQRKILQRTGKLEK